MIGDIEQRTGEARCVGKARFFDSHHTRFAPYPSKCSSLLTIERFSAKAWAINMRSKGSLCGPGSKPARMPCSLR